MGWFAIGIRRISASINTTAMRSSGLRSPQPCSGSMQSLNSAHDSDASSARRRNRFTLLLLIAVCAAPIVASYIAYYVWQPSGHVNYGELLEPRPLPDTALVALDGSTFRFGDLKGS